MNEIANEKEQKACAACVTAQGMGANYCPSCGRRATADAPSAQAEGSPSGGPSEESPLPDDSDKGTKSQETSDGEPPRQRPEAEAGSATKKCACGQALPIDAKFCHICGVPLGDDLPRYTVALKNAGKGGAQATMDGPELAIGKTGECGLAIPCDAYISRRHARIFRSDEAIYVEDLGSSNGTFLRVRRPLPIEPGDEILVGTTLLVFEKAEAWIHPIRKGMACAR